MKSALLALLMVLAASPGGGAEAEFAAGEAAFSAGDTTVAETHYRKTIEIDPSHVRAILRLATVVSWNNRLGESTSLYERALMLDPESREARLGLARVHAWAGHYNDARRIYLEILAGNPKDIEARNGLAAALSWEGKLDDALALYDETLAIEPGNGDALSGRARVLYWQGRKGEARAALDQALAAHPGDRDALKLDAAIREGALSVLSASAGVAHDSDRNAVNVQRAAYSFAPTAATTSEISYDRYDATQPGSPDGRIETLKAAGSLRLGRAITASGSLGLEQDTRGPSSTSRLRLAGTTGADLRYNDQLSFSGSFESEGFAATARSINRDVAMTALTLTAAYVPAPRVSSRFTLQRTNFTEEPDAKSDGVFHGNRRGLMAAYARWAVPAARPKIGLSWTERYYKYERSTGDGYFAPRRYLASVAGIDLSDRITKRLGWSVDATLGLQSVLAFGSGAADTNTVKGYHVTASYDFDRGVTLEAYAGQTNLALQMGTGFRSTEAGIRLRWRIGSGAGANAGGTP